MQLQGCWRSCFRRLKESNLAHLSKQAWCVAVVIDSLLQNVIGEKYFPFSNFLDAGLSSSPSFYLALAVGCPRNPANARVADLITADREWNLGLIKSEFHPHDAECILGIDLRGSPERDKLIWHYGKQGRFSVGSAYHVVRLINGEAGASCVPPSWHFIWKSKAQPKVLLFAWRAARNALPTLSQLRCRGVRVERNMQQPSEGEGRCGTCAVFLLICTTCMGNL
ncbi:UNVERIFIED_CONTAM: hypothetical protein Sradi_4424800 [Sesamum radiatum]|uniref:Reverse transcriptase zinc-binding domain-containing protein n=1 Tax=Sesamum radiatum TaxID=300843 RepID=A0AAW2NQY8_SESRA